MSRALYFDSKSSETSTIVLPKHGSEIILISFRFYLFKICSSAKVDLFSARKFSIFLSYQNSLNLSTSSSSSIKLVSNISTNQ